MSACQTNYRNVTIFHTNPSNPQKHSFLTASEVAAFSFQQKHVDQLVITLELQILVNKIKVQLLCEDSTECYKNEIFSLCTACSSSITVTSDAHWLDVLPFLGPLSCVRAEACLNLMLLKALHVLQK